jgi:hypothetical protein
MLRTLLILASMPSARRLPPLTVSVRVNGVAEHG